MKSQDKSDFNQEIKENNKLYIC